MKAISHKTICRFVLVWFALWMSVIMPGHTRGVVRLPGMEKTASEGSSCCCGDGQSACETSTAGDLAGQTEDDNDAPPDPAKCCAVCYFNATLNTPPPLTLYTPYLGQLDEIAYLTQEAQPPHERRSPDLYRGRPPPRA